MTSYRFRRRAFIAALSGGVGLKIMLRNLESSARGLRSPARLLVTHWPVGIVAGSNDALWKPTSGSVGGSPALQRFAELGLGPDMTVIRGVSTTHLALNGGGGAEGGTVVLTTGKAAGGTRTNFAEPDDAFASGGSFDQVLREKLPALQRPAPGPQYANSIADSRSDRGEIAPRCLSYASELQSVNTYSGGTAMEAKPLRPVLSPVQQFTNLFSTFVPGTAGAGGSGGTGGTTAPPRVADAMLKKLVGKRSVLDFALEELNQVRRMAPGEARAKLDIHTDAVTAAERQIANAINSAYPASGGAAGSGGSAGAGGSAIGGTTGSGDPSCGACTTRPPSVPNVIGLDDPDDHGSGGDSNVFGTQDDAPLHEQVGRLHLDILRAAFVCDIIRVGTYQWSGGTNHVAFTLYPNDTRPYMHHPTSHRISGPDTYGSSTVAGLVPVAQFLFNVQSWYFARHAESLALWKNALDGCGNSLLDFTCIPFLTENTTCNHERSNMPAMIIGGKKLGFIHDRYVTEKMTVNQLWGTIAPAFGHESTDLPFAAPVAGFWAKP